MEVRLLLAFLLMGAVMFLTPYFFKSQVPASRQEGRADRVPNHARHARRVRPTPRPLRRPTSRKSRLPRPCPPAPPPQKPEPAVDHRDRSVQDAFSNQGATVRSWLLKKYKGNDNKPLDLVNTAAGVDFPFSLYFPNEKPAAKVNWAWYKQTVDPDSLGVTYEFSDGHISVRKVFRFQKAATFRWCPPKSRSTASRCPT